MRERGEKRKNKQLPLSSASFISLLATLSPYSVEIIKTKGQWAMTVGQ